MVRVLKFIQFIARNRENVAIKVVLEVVRCLDDSTCDDYYTALILIKFKAMSSINNKINKTSVE